MVTRTRFAPSPTGSLHLGGAISAAANRRRGHWFLLRIDDTDVEREVPGAVERIVADLEWLGIGWDEGPLRQSGRAERHREAARTVGSEDVEGALRFGRLTLLRPDGSPTYHLASVVDDADFEITHVVRGSDHRPNSELQQKLARALGFEPPEYVHHGLLLGEDGRKLSKRGEAVSSVEDLRHAGIPAEAARAYLDELGEPAHDVHLDLPRLRRLAIDAISALPEEELAARVGAPVELAQALRGARDLNEARAMALTILEPQAVKLPGEARPTLERFSELRANGLDGKEIVRELKAVGGDLKALRLALTGAERGPELWAVIAALPRDEALRRIDAAL
ncbi:MAG: glutamate--tRNA ligase family protein [Gaiellaceae bacterium MAG52_C11]|nr:glutamate--tRNA ligase family protein [Candidatus Gaiellasilicea maunaloa]